MGAGIFRRDPDRRRPRSPAPRQARARRRADPHGHRGGLRRRTLREVARDVAHGASVFHHRRAPGPGTPGRGRRVESRRLAHGDAVPRGGGKAGARARASFRSHFRDRARGPGRRGRLGGPRGNGDREARHRHRLRGTRGGRLRDAPRIHTAHGKRGGSAREFARRWQRHLWIAVLTVFLAVLIGGYFLAKRVDSRLRGMREASESLGRGELAIRLPVDAHDELAALARVLNSMAENLQQKLTELQAERDLSQAVIGNLSEGVALLGSDLTIRHANDRFWALVGADRPSGAMIPRLASARQPHLEEIVRQAVRQGLALRREAALYVDERREYEITVLPIRESPEAGDWLLTIRDLKPERTMANLRREFVANVSHELKTPLTSIRGYAETLLQGGLEDEGNRSRFVETIHAQAVRLEALVEDLLELADLERPDAALEIKDWNFAEIAREMASAFEEVAERRGLELQLDAPRDLHARVDRNRIEVAMRNLLDNAIKYTDAGSVKVTVRAEDGDVRVSITDTGRGISPEHLPRVFERFYRVDLGRSRAFGGTGLGLSIVKHAIELHGGRVGVVSTPGAGTTFWFEVPANSPKADAGPRNGLS
ncbi:MAG: HAMP domain-containing protein [Candidatus Eisenbacteria bacterium]|uniref:histidine kinase n=1 Tax=Eiseniibacteriota bacterium TaxID=2212470 RepID=A0A538S9B4_UNCEI|nr:MAG: HAMP domain-containing protein [Candidatus Eisenbacteria bacterium]